jgi:hypothetical protein
LSFIATETAPSSLAAWKLRDDDDDDDDDANDEDLKENR